jgi:hypothetical protein
MPAVNTADGVVLLIGSGRRAYREYLLKGASARCPLWLIDAEPVGWQEPYVVGGTVVEPLDAEREVPDQEGLLAAAVALARQRPVLGVFTYDELLVIPTARVADRLGLPGFSADGAERCRDKHRSRMALAAAGLRQPRFGLARAAAEATQIARSFGFPVIVKPCGMAASIGVVRVDHPAEVAGAFTAAERASRSGPPAYEGRALVEELVEGPEISVDGAVSGGEYQPFCLARKQSGFHPSFEETGHIVDAADPLLADPELARVLADAHRALGLRDGITHAELRLSPRGPVVIEVNARLGGDLIPYLGQLATGVDPGWVAAEVALGNRPRIEPTRREIAGIRFLYPPEDCRVEAVVVPAAGAVPGLTEARPMVAPGAKLRLPPRAHLGRYAYLVCTAEDPATCQARLDDATKLADIHCEPLAPALADERPW